MRNHGVLRRRRKKQRLRAELQVYHMVPLVLGTYSVAEHNTRSRRQPQHPAKRSAWQRDKVTEKERYLICSSVEGMCSYLVTPGGRSLKRRSFSELRKFNTVPLHFFWTEITMPDRQTSVRVSRVPSMTSRKFTHKYAVHGGSVGAAIRGRLMTMCALSELACGE